MSGKQDVIAAPPKNAYFRFEYIRFTYLSSQNTEVSFKLPQTKVPYQMFTWTPSLTQNLHYTDVHNFLLAHCPKTLNKNTNVHNTNYKQHPIPPI